MIHVDESYFFYNQILDLNEVHYFFTFDNNIRLLEQQQFFQ